MATEERKPTLYDLLTLQQSSSIFFDYLRYSAHLCAKVLDRNAKTTIFLPSNANIMELPWKPHFGVSPPSGGKFEIAEEEGRKNAERWLSAHMVASAYTGDSSLTTVETILIGNHISLVKRPSVVTSGNEWSNYVVQQKDREVKVLNRLEASNGLIYLIDGTLSII